MQGLEIMCDDPSSVDVLYGCVQESDGSAMIQQIADKLTKMLEDAECPQAVVQWDAYLDLVRITARLNLAGHLLRDCYYVFEVQRIQMELMSVSVIINLLPDLSSNMCDRLCGLIKSLQMNVRRLFFLYII
ncbi:hypothetical protein B566_EDAN015934 [Ephemera danica]|nr:hypothetical protein B566_EDAN015934 [Ephemera danica]